MELKKKQEDKLLIPKSDVQAGPGLVHLDEELKEIQDPLKAFNEKG